MCLEHTGKVHFSYLLHIPFLLKFKHNEQAKVGLAFMHASLRG